MRIPMQLFCKFEILTIKIKRQINKKNFRRQRNSGITEWRCLSNLDRINNQIVLKIGKLYEKITENWK